MVILTMDFYIPRAIRLLLRGEDGSIQPSRASAFFDEEQVRELAAFPGLKWKVWSVSPDGAHGSGVYLFETAADAQLRARYAKTHYWRSGLLFVDCRMYEVLEDCSRVTRAPLDVPANPTATAVQCQQILHGRAGSPVRRLRGAAKRLKAQ